MWMVLNRQSLRGRCKVNLFTEMPSLRRNVVSTPLCCGWAELRPLAYIPLERLGGQTGFSTSGRSVRRD
jgi:hypothetical protein